MRGEGSWGVGWGGRGVCETGESERGLGEVVGCRV